jgi:hypothetical protein
MNLSPAGRPFIFFSPVCFRCKQEEKEDEEKYNRTRYDPGQKRIDARP